MNPTQRIRILLVDDHPVVREGLRSCLANHPELEIVGEAADGRDAVAKAQALAPHVVLMDITMPQMDGMEATAEIHRCAPAAKVLALTAHTSSEYIQRIVKAGASGYVLKDASPRELVQAIVGLQNGEPFFSPEILGGLLKSFVGRSRTSASCGDVPLSPRETQVLIYIAEGRSNKEIAGFFKVSVRTVETHRERLMAKLNIHTIAGLTKYAIAHGLVSVD